MNCLRLALLCFIASTALTHPLISREQTSTCQKTKVVVLGAGVAGIPAAVWLSIVLSTLDYGSCTQQALNNNSVTDFLIAEYNREIGDRCMHAPFGKDNKANAYTIELGANWVRNLRNVQQTNCADLSLLP